MKYPLPLTVVSVRIVNVGIKEAVYKQHPGSSYTEGLDQSLATQKVCSSTIALISGISILWELVKESTESDIAFEQDL